MNKYIRYLLYFFPHALVVIICWVTNPIACLFPSRQANGRDKLFGVFNLWSTHDNYSDEFFYGGYGGFLPTVEMQTEYNNSRWVRYSYRLKWLKRNTGYGWTYKFFSMPKGEGFQWKGLHWLPFGYHNDYNIGWKEHGGIERLSYACRPLGLRENTA